MTIPTDSEIITSLGGQSAVARICGLKQPAVNAWHKSNRIPNGWRKFLQSAYPDKFTPVGKGNAARKKSGQKIGKAS